MGAAAIGITVTPISGTNDLLRDEAALAFVDVENRSGVQIEDEGTLNFEVKRESGPWVPCTGPQPPIDVPGRRDFIFGSPLRPGETRKLYYGSLGRLQCPLLTHVVGGFQIRAVLTSRQMGIVVSPPQQVTVREPTGLDAAALRYKEEKGRMLSTSEFLIRFPGSRYAAPFLPAEAPENPPQPMSARAAGFRNGPGFAELEPRQALLRAFLDRNPDHLFSELLLREYVAIAAARGDRAALEWGVGKMEARRPGSQDTLDARALLEQAR
jgi:hypothetical protein